MPGSSHHGLVPKASSDPWARGSHPDLWQGLPMPGCRDDAECRRSRPESQHDRSRAPRPLHGSGRRGAGARARNPCRRT